MKNAIKYYYNINPSDIHQVNKKIKFNINNRRYILYPTTKNKEELIDVYKLHLYILSLGKYCHKIILNKNNEIITLINNIKYVLLEVNTFNGFITLQDILYYVNTRIEKNKYPSIQRESWKQLWINIIEYMEYQMNQFANKYKLLSESYNYYIGIIENCISLVDEYKDQDQYLTINHNRLHIKTTLDEFYNPLEFILDRRVRDLGEYTKKNTNENIKIIEQIINSKILNNYEIQLLFIRILYPSTFIDIYDEIINEKKNENEIKKYLSKVEYNENEIKKIYHYIRSISKLPEIEWLNKN